MRDWQRMNLPVIEEFRTRRGKVKGWAPLILLTSVGARSGQARTSPLMYIPDGDRIIAIASKGAEPTNPDWYYNLLAQPAATVEVGDEKFDVIARELSGDERKEAFAKAAALHPFFDGYRKRVKREIPVFALERRTR
jgi:F420H(2)-dependent quinone reductase